MNTDARSTVSLMDLARSLPGMALQAPGMLRNAVHMLVKSGDRASIGLFFQRGAAQHPDRPFLRFEGRQYTWGEANSEVNRYANVLAAHGVGRGDVVGILMANRPEALFTVLATVKLGATAGLLNHNQRDVVLQHSFGLLNSVLDVIGEECADALETLTQARPAVLWSEQLAAQARIVDASNPAVTEQITAGERAYLIFTSGTTGLPKASVMTHQRWTKSMAGIGGLGVRLNGRDTLYCCLPLYHNNALTVALSSVIAGGATFALGRKFSATRFWDEAIANQATAFVYIGELCRYLLNQPPKRTDRSHTVRLCVGNGLRPELWDEFQSRFGLERIVEFYGASEGNVAFINAFSVDKTAGFTPLPFAIVEYDDATGKALRHPDGRLRRVHHGGVGLLLAKVTNSSPFDGYTDAAATESKLVRDGFKQGDCWFDTGDLVRDQRFGHIAFVDRLGDTFRWKGENVATTEVEGAFDGIDSVTQAVVFGVDIPGADGKAGMAAVTLHEGAAFDGKVAAKTLYGHLPTYAVPLFIRVVPELEQTSTFKSRKVGLRKQGCAPDGHSTLYVLAGRTEGYVPAYPEYAAEVAAGRLPGN
ncbi:long-chain-acyl-CoA synthetase [Nocardia seriolae]|uniref:3-hydroxybenzoate--CoA/4-hydroxybenzoate--CoA ligase n=2 Tax=Nocardia seriolae TaxID=37332 RepID=A0ABC8APQ1_9NOCA|nr:long-chain-acyl-CoA synthetase [Nocardia seriolae]APA95982.1 3-hydroxybenzoate--CoA/4-hydroxybenzoate--CoA ligase [Nocardia seriolae]PSK29832.1 long-chain-acyl-CoA synthetase [Nocardia seriolae]QOW33376.1 long-chain-acyl-CoA synthetase [Nocardia seriolae]QUN20876.1 long-chain-acyl-CoA synthetase [Nocardia seriolae]WNJ60410.1 long-chain-acyl-CoA synthetase [Nocardia seriolae]